MKKLNEMRALLDETAADVEKFFEKGNSSAGTRVRVAMQKVKSLAQEMRVEISEKKKAE